MQAQGPSSLGRNFIFALLAIPLRSYSQARF